MVDHLGRPPTFSAVDVVAIACAPNNLANCNAIIETSPEPCTRTVPPVTRRSPVSVTRMLKALYASLKPGGELVVGDYSAKPGAGTSVAETLHRSDEALVKSEIEAAGFKLIDQAIACAFPRMPVMSTRIAGQNRSVSS